MQDWKPIPPLQTEFVGPAFLFYGNKIVIYDPLNQALSCELVFKSEEVLKDFDHKYMQLQKSIVDLFSELNEEQTASLKNFLITFLRRDMNGLI